MHCHGIAYVMENKNWYDIDGMWCSCNILIFDSHQRSSAHTFIYERNTNKYLPIFGGLNGSWMTFTHWWATQSFNEYFVRHSNGTCITMSVQPMDAPFKYAVICSEDASTLWLSYFIWIIWWIILYALFRLLLQSSITSNHQVFGITICMNRCDLCVCTLQSKYLSNANFLVYLDSLPKIVYQYKLLSPSSMGSVNSINDKL